MNDHQVMHAMHIDDSYKVQRVLANSASGSTELVTIGGAGLFVRKKMSFELARRRVWSALAECDSPRLPHVEATYELPDRFVVVYDFVPGTSLEHLVEGAPEAGKDAGEAGSADAASASEGLPDAGELSCSSGALGVVDAVRIARQVCEAAHALHTCGIVHRDIAPGNIVVSSDGAHLIDLGIARMRVEGASRDTASLGTWGFASPEQYGFAQTDARSDVYSIGRLLGYMLTGVRPGGDDYDAALAACASVPPALRAAIGRACAFEPSARFQSAEEFGAALEGALSGDESAPATSAGEDSSGKRAGENPAHDSYAPHAPDGARCATPSSAPSPTRRRSAFARSRFAKAVIAAAIALVVAAACAVGFFSSGGSNGGSSAAPSAASDSQTEPDAPKSSDSSSLVDEPAATSSSFDQDATAHVDGLLEVTESGWSFMSSGYVNCAFILYNASDEESVEFPEVRMTGRVEDGSVLFTETQTLPHIGPGETLCYSGPIGNGSEPASVEFTVLSPPSRNVSKGKSSSSFSVDGASAGKGMFGPSFTGSFVKTAQGDFGDDEAMVTVVLRDESGSIVGGGEQSFSSAEVGLDIPFEVQIIDPPKFATFEVTVRDC